MALKSVFRGKKSVLKLLSERPEIACYISSRRHASSGYKVVVVGGGTGGCSTAAKFCRSLGKGNVAVIEPSDVSYN